MLLGFIFVGFFGTAHGGRSSIKVENVFKAEDSLEGLLTKRFGDVQACCTLS